MNLRHLLIATLAITAFSASWADPIAQISCSPKTSTLVVQYIDGSDDGFNKLEEFPQTCKLGSASYRLEATRGPYSPGRCGAQPPVSIRLMRNSTPLVADAVFGDNCHGGPAIVTLRVQESNDQLVALEVCAASGFPTTSSRQQCRTWTAGQISALKDRHISQRHLGDQAPSN